jgi:hypothetical protein
MSSRKNETEREDVMNILAGHGAELYNSDHVPLEHREHALTFIAP